MKKGPETEIDRDTFLQEVHVFLDEEFNYNQAGHKGSPPGYHEKTKALRESLLAGYVTDALLTDNRNTMC